MVTATISSSYNEIRIGQSEQEADDDGDAVEAARELIQG